MEKTRTDRKLTLTKSSTARNEKSVRPNVNVTRYESCRLITNRVIQSSLSSETDTSDDDTRSYESTEYFLKRSSPGTTSAHARLENKGDDIRNLRNFLSRILPQSTGSIKHVCQPFDSPKLEDTSASSDEGIDTVKYGDMAPPRTPQKQNERSCPNWRSPHPLIKGYEKPKDDAFTRLLRFRKILNSDFRNKVSVEKLEENVKRDLQNRPTLFSNNKKAQIYPSVGRQHQPLLPANICKLLPPREINVDKFYSDLAKKQSFIRKELERVRSLRRQLELRDETYRQIVYPKLYQRMSVLPELKLSCKKSVVAFGSAFYPPKSTSSLLATYGSKSSPPTPSSWVHAENPHESRKTVKVVNVKSTDYLGGISSNDKGDVVDEQQSFSSLLAKCIGNGDTIEPDVRPRRVLPVPKVDKIRSEVLSFQKYERVERRKRIMAEDLVKFIKKPTKQISFSSSSDDDKEPATRKSRIRTIAQTRRSDKKFIRDIVKKNFVNRGHCSLVVTPSLMIDGNLKKTPVDNLDLYFPLNAKTGLRGKKKQPIRRRYPRKREITLKDVINGRLDTPPKGLEDVFARYGTLVDDSYDTEATDDPFCINKTGTPSSIDCPSDPDEQIPKVYRSRSYKNLIANNSPVTPDERHETSSESDEGRSIVNTKIKTRVLHRRRSAAIENEKTSKRH